VEPPPLEVAKQERTGSLVPFIRKHFQRVLPETKCRRRKQKLVEGGMPCRKSLDLEASPPFNVGGEIAHVLENHTLELVQPLSCLQTDFFTEFSDFDGLVKPESAPDAQDVIECGFFALPRNRDDKTKHSPSPLSRGAIRTC
jgi:hypothetical protein